MKKTFTFIDLFAGIGGFRIAAQNLGGKCVFSSEFDKNAQQTYYHNFGEVPAGDITLPETKSLIPDNFDFLFGGFPCQPFSIAGYRKGFADTRGTLFYDIAEIIKNKRPKAIFLENVKNLMGHDGGKTFNVINATLNELGYEVFAKVMNAMEYVNIPQNRERIFIVCFDPKRVKNYKEFKFPEKNQDYGQKAKQYLSSMIYNKTVIIRFSEIDRYGRILGHVYLNDKDINLEMLKAGMAWHYKHYDKSKDYSDAEEAARNNKIGLWQQPDPIAPWDFRKQNK